ncbi:hypothetical protein JRQ81_002669 [Phrynocephalus forsythii]|uniref:Uncharacterized protein n=1 Tax=Phrynocephalus forsythii TaxID=171643 RepID=A0A9Q0XIS0_9SAUR|nr:hypothetical protein JRQ81_002669 [Phrynocephalus forsythii]
MERLPVKHDSMNGAAHKGVPSSRTRPCLVKPSKGVSAPNASFLRIFKALLNFLIDELRQGKLPCSDVHGTGYRWKEQ